MVELDKKLENIKNAFLLVREEIEKLSDDFGQAYQNDPVKFSKEMGEKAEYIRRAINSELSWTYGYFGEQFNCSDDFN